MFVILQVALLTQLQLVFGMLSCESQHVRTSRVQESVPMTLQAGSTTSSLSMRPMSTSCGIALGSDATYWQLDSSAISSPNA